MGDIINRVQLPVKCSKCGNKLYRVQYMVFGDKHVHTIDLCPHCEKELDYDLKKGFSEERKANLRNKKLFLLLMIIAIVALVLYIFGRLGVI